jgi:uncharacterized protein YjbI with pentapeptide repeats
MAVLTSRPTLSVTPAAIDVLHIVDVSDTTDAPTGSSRQITVNTLLGFEDSRTATYSNKTLVSPTLSGAFISGATLSGGTLNGVLISGATISGGYLRTPILNGGFISGATLSGGALINVFITGATLSGAYLQSPVITGGLVTGATLTGGAISGIVDLAVADGGTGASDAATARTNLGLAIGTDVQAYDADLTTWAGKTAPSGTVVGDTDVQTLTNKTLTTPVINGAFISNATINSMMIRQAAIGLGSDATGDLYYRASTGLLARLGLGTTGQVLTANASLPAWQTASGGGDMNTATYDPATIAEQLVGLTATQTLTNKTLTNPIITGARISGATLNGGSILSSSLVGGYITGMTLSGGAITGIADLAIVDGGTGASDALTARTNLGLVIGTNVQAWDADLDTWAGKTAPSGVVVGTTDTQTLSAKTLTTAILDGGFISGATLSGVSIINTRVTGATLSGVSVASVSTDIQAGTFGLVAHRVQSDASDGLLIEAGNGTDVAILGAGNTANVTFYGGVNVDGAHVVTGLTTLNGGAFISGATLTGGSLNSSRLSGGFITGATLSGGALIGAFVTGATISGGSLLPTTITGGLVTGATLSGGAVLSNVHINASLPSDDLYSGISVTLTAGVTLAQWDAGYMATTSKIELADADAIGTAGAIALATAAMNANAQGNFLLNGIVRNDAWTWTVGGLIYLSTTPGGMTQTAPSATDDVVQVLGVALTADSMYWNPQLVQVEHT